MGLARPWAGIGTYTTEILQALAAARPAARFTVYVSGHAAGLNDSRFELRPVPGTPLLGRHFRWPRQIRRERHTAYFGPAGVMPLGNVGAPAIVTAHDMAIYRHPEWFPGGQALSVRLVVPRSMRRASAVIAVSRHTAADVGELFGVPEDRLRVVYEGVAPRYRPLAPEATERVRRRYHLPERFVLFVGTVEPRKNLETLLEAWSGLRARPPLVVAGGWGWRCEGVRRRLESTPEVQLLGPVQPSELPSLYNMASCLAHPAWYEGFGLTPLEALACGTPVVASSSTSLPEVVGDSGLLVDPADVEGWRGALERLLDDAALRAELRERGLRRAAEFSWERAARETWHHIDRVISGAVAG